MTLRGLTLKELLSASDSGDWGDEPKDTDTIGVLRASNIRDDGQLAIGDLAMRSFSREKRERLLLRAGDILLERSGGSDNRPVGRVAFVGVDTQVVFTNFLHRLRADPALIIPE